MRDFLIVVVGALIGALLILLMKLPVDKIALVVLANPAAGVAAVAALFAFVSGILAPFVQWRVGRRQGIASQTSADAAMLTAKTVGNREVAKLRMGWMDSLRITLSKYHSILMSSGDARAVDDDIRELSRLGTELDLLLNRKDKLQNDLWEVCDKIYNFKTQAERQNMDRELVEKGRAVLKGEWEKVKREMRGERFQAGEHAGSQF